MKMHAHSLPPDMRRRAPIDVDGQRPGRLRIGKVAVTLVLLLLAACAGAGNETTADGTGATALKRPVRGGTVRAEVRRPAGSSITTASLSKAQNEGVVDLPYQPTLNSRWVGTVEMRETTTKAGRNAESIVARERGEYRIVGKLENGYRIDYTLRDGSVEGNTTLTQLLAPLIESTKGQSFVFETDETGSPVRIPDVAKWKALAVKAIDVVAESKPEFASVPQVKQFVDGLRSQYEGATPESGVALFLDHYIRYSMVQGLRNMRIGEERSYDDELVNPLIGAKMRAKGSFKVISVDRAKGLATIEWQLAVLPEDLNKATLEFVKRFIPEGQDTKKFEEAMAQLKIEHLDKATYKIALADGVVRRMDRTSVVKTQGGEKKTVMTVTMQPAGSVAKSSRDLSRGS
jgi:hypothetical protein